MCAAAGQSVYKLLGNRFRIVRHIGCGGMGEVYEAEDILLQDRVALKTIRPDIASRPEITGRFKREIFFSKKVTHPNICRIHDLGVHEEPGRDTLFLTMEFLEGETLSERLARGPMSEKEALPLVEDMASALDAAHRADVIHRDFKPANVMLVTRGTRVRAVVTDFGLAQAAQADSSTRLTEPDRVIGTAAYMSPEQVTGGEITPSSDIYALGIVMYEMATGRLPFTGDNGFATALKHATDDPVPPTDLIPHLNRQWEHVILRCLHKDPETRFPSAAAVKDALLQPTTPALLPLEEQQPRFLMILLAAACILIGLSAVFLWKWVRAHYAPLPVQKRVAVLEFENVGGDPGNKAFCEGLMQSFTNKLTELEEKQNSLSIVPASDVRRGKVSSVREAQREFNANLVITGSVQRSPGGLTLIVNLVNADELKQIKSRNLFVPENDPVTMEDGAVKAAADLLEVTYRSEVQKRFLAGDTPVPDAYTFYLQGTGYLLRGRAVDEALTEFGRALKLDPNYALGHAGLGEACWQKYRATNDRQWIDCAWDEGRKAVRLNPKLAAPHRTLAMVNAGTGNYREAIKEAQRALDIDPADFEAWTQLATMQAQLGERDRAEATLKKAIAIKPDYWNSYNQLGKFYFRYGKYQDAEKAFRRVTELVPDNPGGYTNLGVMYHLQNRQKEAETVLQTSIRVRPTTAAYSNLATVYFFEGRYSDAVPIMEKLTAGSKNYVVWGNMADDYRWTPGSRPKADQAYRTAIRFADESLGVNPKDTEALSGLALYQAKSDHTQPAVINIQKALTLAPNDVNVLFKAAVVFELARRREQALAYLSSALRKGFSVNEIQVEPELVDLRRDARYKALITGGK